MELEKLTRRNFLRIAVLGGVGLTLGLNGCAPAKNVNWKEVPDSEFSLKKFEDWFYIHELYCGLNPNLKFSHISSYPGTTFKMSIGTQYQGSYITPGIDYHSNYLYAAADGVVVDIHKLNTGRLGGNIVDILHADSNMAMYFITRYGHLGDVKVKYGEKVKRGSLIADTIDSNAAKFMVKIWGNYVNPDNFGPGHSFMKYFEGNEPTVTDVPSKVGKRTQIWKSIIPYIIPEVGLTEDLLMSMRHRLAKGMERYDWDDLEKFKFLECLYQARPQYFPKLTPDKFAEMKSDFYANQPGILTLPLKP
jgi:hypothetical protein